MTRALKAITLALGLSGCSDNVWLGGDEPPPLPGERVPVMVFDDGLIADVGADANPPRLPAVLPGDWPQAGGAADHAPGRVAFDGEPELFWRRDVGSASPAGGALPAPIVGGGSAFAMDGDGFVVAMDFETGETLWRRLAEGVDPSDRIKSGGFAYRDGWLFVTSGGGVLAGLNAETGETVWRADLRAPVRSGPTVVEGAVVTLTADNGVTAVEPSSGELLWRHIGFFEQAAMLGGSSPAVGAGLVIAPYSSGEVFALDLATGRELWTDAVLRPRRTLAIGAINDIDALPVIDGGEAYVVGQGGEMAAIDLSRGARIWDVDIASTQTPWVAGDVVFAVSDRAEAVAINRADGRIRWVRQLERTLDPNNPDSVRVHWSGPALAGDLLWLVGSHGRLVGLDPLSGDIERELDAPRDVWTPPVFASGAMLLFTLDGELIVYR